jgi:hypothetical protein
MIKPGAAVLVLCSLLIDFAFAFLFKHQVVMFNSPKGGLIYQLFTWPWVDVVQERLINAFGCAEMVARTLRKASGLAHGANFALL